MTIQRMVQQVKFRWNKLDSNKKKNFPLAFIDDIINDAINTYIEMFYGGNNSKRYNIGFEITQQRIDMLSTLVVPHKAFTATKVSNGIYKLDLNTLTPKYRHFLRGHVITTNCNNAILKLDHIRNNDYDVKIRDANTKPSLTWRRALSSIKQEGVNSALYIYTPEEITANTITGEIEYLRQPVKVFSSGYDSYEYILGDNTAYRASDPAIHCDLPETYHSVVVDIAVQELARILEDPNKLSLIEEKFTKTT